MSDTSTHSNPGWHVSQAEHFKSLFDYLKHISTLSTGSILLIATFLEKFFREPLHSWLIGVAIGGFFLSLVASLAAYSVMVFNFPRVDREFSTSSVSVVEQVAFAGGIMLTWVALIVGLGALAFFFLAN